ncbi:exosortase/archaeosortase family protein [Pseudonocardiaceae bacterium YIM PH 21723]|nr:exosortase/archaeosortase family protein [Pseudonocardiaceae bacterium YIM PH 21723]
MNKYFGRIVALLLAVVAVALVVVERSYRVLEMELSAILLPALGFGRALAIPERESLIFGIGTNYTLGLRMTPECTSVFLVIPLVLIASLMAFFRPQAIGKVLWALGIGGAVLILTNQLRMINIVYLVKTLGTERGYYWGHTFGGSMISVIGGAVALVLFVWLATRGRRAPSKPKKAVAA